MKSHLRQFSIFCTKFSRPICPTNRDTLLAFGRLLSLTCSYGHIKNLFGSIKFLHRALNAEYPDDDFQVNTTLKAIKREKSSAPLQTLPITPEILEQLYLFIDIKKPHDLALWCSFLVAFYCLFRKSNVVPESLDKFDPQKGLSRRKISINGDASSALVFVNWSKTIQFNNKDIVVPLQPNKKVALDPVHHLNLLFSQFDLPDYLPAFSYLEGGQVRCITYRGFTASLRKLLDVAGYRAKLYAGHSFRRGGATLLYKLKADPLLIRASGDWSSDCFTRYVFLSLEQRLKAQMLMSGYTTL